MSDPRPTLRVEHEIHGRRRGRNAGVGWLLAGLVAIVFGLTVVKVTSLESIRQFETYDHVLRPQIVPGQGDGPAMSGDAAPEDAAAAAEEAGQ